MKNGLYNGLDNGLHNGGYNGLDNGLRNGLFNNETYQKDIDILNYLNHPNNKNLTVSDKKKVSEMIKLLKANNLWSKMIGCYMFLGNSSASCALNLKNPYQFNLTFYGGWVFNNGGLPNGINAYADTGINSSTNLSSTSTHMSYYSTTNNSGGALMGVDLVSYLLMYLKRNGVSLFGVYTGPLRGGIVLSDISGFWVVSRINNTEFFSYNKSVSPPNNYLLYTSEPPKPQDNANIYLAARNEGFASLFSDQQCKFASVGQGLTVSECSLLNDIIKNIYS